MENNPLISIIIPVYNVEKYLEECIDSILTQTYVFFELIIVNDGSTDESSNICESYQEIDHRIKVIHKENSGLSSARNDGFIESKGDFIIYLDSDDYWSDREALSKIVSVIRNNSEVDIIYFRRFAFDDLTKKQIYQYPLFDVDKINGRGKLAVLKNLIETDNFIPSACNKVVRRSVHCNIQFKKHTFCEDIDWNFRITECAHNLYVINDLFYAYRVRHGSITNTYGYKRFNDLLTIVEDWTFRLKNKKSKESTLLLNYCAYQYSILLGLYPLSRINSHSKETFGRMQQLSEVLTFSLSPKVYKVYRLKKILGLRLTSILLGIYIKLRR